MTWIWIGCLVLIPGSIVCMWPQLELGESRVWAGARGVAATAASVILGIMLAATPAFGQSMTPGDMDGLVHIENDAERVDLREAPLHVRRRARATCCSTCSCGDGRGGARAHPRARCGRGETRDQIVAEYAAEYGTEALAVPPNTGVFRAIYVVPVVGIALGAFGLARMLRRWRRSDGDRPEAAAAASGGAEGRLRRAPRRRAQGSR